MQMKKRVVTFGEVLLRLSPPGNLRLQQARTLDLVYGGAEANVAVCLANFGFSVQYVTRLPDNALGRACRQWLRQFGVGLDHTVSGGERLGLYFLEIGAGNRPSRVIYDRAHSSFATIAEGMVSWDEVFGGATWFHWSGITPAVSATAAQMTRQAVKAARRAGLTVSCDLNYRHKLWQWGEAPGAVMPDLVRLCDVLQANGAHLMLDIPDLPVGDSVEEAIEACARLSHAFPNLKQIAMTCREDTGDGQGYSAVLWQAGEHRVSTRFTLTEIVDRVGAGDAFMAGLIFGLHHFDDDLQRTVDFAAATAALKHAIAGDATLVSVDEVEQLLASGGRVDIRR
jgi:2-dehydro-3-deoxygluconokinase